MSRRLGWLIGAVVLALVSAVVVIWGSGAPDDEAPTASPTPSRAAPTVSAVPTTLRPLPADAKDDRPAFYDDGSGCQVEDGDPRPVVCSSGDETSDRTVMLVGDSKIAQWETAYSELGTAGGFRVDTVTKSACPFTDAMVTAGGKKRPDCRQWGRRALRQVIAAKPDVVVTSQRADTALLAGGGKDSTRGAMIRGLRSYWSQLQAAGIRVVVQLDNPFPTTHPVYRCVADHPDRPDRCAFRTDEGVAESSAPVLREAAEGLPGVGIIDLTSTICPDDGWCPAVIGDVLVYRAGSHLTRTFVVSVRHDLSDALARATDGEFGATAP